LKIKIINPSGDVIEFEADYWEFSQNKFEKEDIVMLFYKDENIQCELQSISSQSNAVISIQPEKKIQPSSKGILNDNFDTSIPLIQAIGGEEELNISRINKGIKVVPKDKPFISIVVKEIETTKYLVDSSTIKDAVEELTTIEKEISSQCQIQILKDPIIYFTADEKFVVREGISIGEEEVTNA